MDILDGVDEVLRFTWLLPDGARVQRDVCAIHILRLRDANQCASTKKGKNVVRGRKLGERVKRRSVDRYVRCFSDPQREARGGSSTQN